MVYLPSTLLSIHGEVYRCVDIQVRHMTKQGFCNWFDTLKQDLSRNAVLLHSKYVPQIVSSVGLSRASAHRSEGCSWAGVETLIASLAPSLPPVVPFRVPSPCSNRGDPVVGADSPITGQEKLECFIRTPAAHHACRRPAGKAKSDTRQELFQQFKWHPTARCRLGGNEKSHPGYFVRQHEEIVTHVADYET